VQGAGASPTRATTALFGLVTAALLVLVLTPAAMGAIRSEVPSLSKPAAIGTGNLTSASQQVTGVTTTQGTFEVGQAIVGTGIPALTKINAVGAGTFELSAAASASSPPPVELTAGLDGACGVAVDSQGFLYLAETRFAFNMVKIYNAAEPRVLVTEFAAAGCDLAVDSGGNVYIADPATGTAKKYKPSAPLPVTVATTYALDTAVNGTGTLGSTGARSVAVNPSNQHVTVAEATVNDQQKISFSGTWVGGVDKFTIGNLPGDCSASSVEVTYETAAAARTAAVKAGVESKCGPNVTVASSNAGLPSSTVTFTGKYASQNISLLTCAVNLGAGTCSPVTTNTDGHGGRISTFESNGTLVNNTTGSGVSGASYYGVDVYGANGRIYAIDGSQNKAYVFEPATATALTTITGAPGDAFAEMSRATAAVDQSNGNILVSDVQAHNSVREFSAAGSPVTQLTHTPAFVQPKNSLSAIHPVGLAYDNSSVHQGNVYIVAGSGSHEGSFITGIYAFGPLTLTPPAVGDLDPDLGPTAGGNSVTITGTDLTGATLVKFGANSATITENTATQIKVTVPAGSAGTTDVIVTTPDGESANTAADNYTYVAPPAVTALDPSSGPTAGGNSVTITGTSLNGATLVKFGANSAAITENTATQIKVTVPAGSAGTVDVIVTTPGGSSANTAADNYTYVVAPTVVTTAGAAGISQTAATVAGTVNPNSGNVTVCKVEYGTTAGYGSQANCTSLPGAGSSPVNVSASLSGLTAGTTYHFRVVATSAGGTTNGSDQTFKTLDDTCATKASLCPPNPDPCTVNPASCDPCVIVPPSCDPCVVPKLSGKSQGQAKSALTAAKCTLGKVTKPKAKKGKKLGPLVVKSSSPAAGTVLPQGSKVNVKLGPKPKKKKK